MSEKFSEANLQDMDPAELIYHLSTMSYDSVQEARPDMKYRPGFRSSYKDGWYPEAMAQMAHLSTSRDTKAHKWL